MKRVKFSWTFLVSKYYHKTYMTTGDSLQYAILRKQGPKKTKPTGMFDMQVKFLHFQTQPLNETWQHAGGIELWLPSSNIKARHINHSATAVCANNVSAPLIPQRAHSSHSRTLGVTNVWFCKQFWLPFTRFRCTNVKALREANRNEGLGKHPILSWLVLNHRHAIASLSELAKAT